MPPEPALSVVVMGYRNEATIVDAVRSVLQQRCEEPFEVVVVTSGGDRSAARLRSAFPALPVVEDPGRLLPGGARNAGIQATRAPVIAFLAGDCIAEPGWIAGRLRAHRRGYAGVAAALTSAGPARPAGWASGFLLFPARLPGRPAGEVAWPDPAAHGLSLDRAVLRRVGAFATDQLIGEDTDMARRLADAGLPIWFEPTVRIGHRGPRNLVALLRDEYRRGGRAVRATRAPRVPPRRLLASEWRLMKGQLRWTLGRAWSYGGEQRWRLAAALPWILAGALARRTGRVAALVAVEPRS